jgi:hypothetical protein
MCANYEGDLEEILYDDERSGPRERRQRLKEARYMANVLGAKFKQYPTTPDESYTGLENLNYDE